MAFSEDASGTSASITTTEADLKEYATPAGAVFQFFARVNSIAKGDVFILRLYVKPESTDGYKEIDSWMLAHTTEEAAVYPQVGVNSIKITGQKVAGTNRTLDWSAWKEA